MGLGRGPVLLRQGVWQGPRRCYGLLSDLLKMSITRRWGHLLVLCTVQCWATIWGTLSFWAVCKLEHQFVRHLGQGRFVGSFHQASASLSRNTPST